MAHRGAESRLTQNLKSKHLQEDDVPRNTQKFASTRKTRAVAAAIRPTKTVCSSENMCFQSGPQRPSRDHLTLGESGPDGCSQNRHQIPDQLQRRTGRMRRVQRPEGGAASGGRGCLWGAAGRFPREWKTLTERDSILTPDVWTCRRKASAGGRSSKLTLTLTPAGE